jgi:hypothetical protein
MGSKLVGIFAVLSIVGSVAWAANSKPIKANNEHGPGYGYGYGGGKVTICHHTHSQSNPTVTITVSANAVPAHLRHDDTIGPCPGD